MINHIKFYYDKKLIFNGNGIKKIEVNEKVYNFHDFFNHFQDFIKLEINSDKFSFLFEYNRNTKKTEFIVTNVIKEHKKKIDNFLLDYKFDFIKIIS